MSRFKLLILFIVGGFLLLVGGLSVALYFFKEAATAVPPALPAVTAATEQANVTGRLPLPELLQKYASNTVECSLAFSEDSALREGTVFIANNELRLDAMLRQGTSSYLSLVVSPNEVVVWRGDVLTLVPERMNRGVSQVPEGSQLLHSWYLEASYVCKPWVVDLSVFAAPRPS